MRFHDFLARLTKPRPSNPIEDALALHRRGEARSDGLALIQSSQSLDVEWRARQIHPWNCNLPPAQKERLFIEQCYADTEAAIHRLFLNCPGVDLIRFKVVRPDTEEELLTGSVAREAAEQCIAGRSSRTKLWQMGVRPSIY